MPTCPPHSECPARIEFYSEINLHNNGTHHARRELRRSPPLRLTFLKRKVALYRTLWQTCQCCICENEENCKPCFDSQLMVHMTLLLRCLAKHSEDPQEREQFSQEKTRLFLHCFRVRQNS
jgi:hypothetical protein